MVYSMAPMAALRETATNVFMNKIHKRRLSLIIFFMTGLSIAAALVFYALNQNMNVFLTPSQIAGAHLAPQDHFRLGGMVKQGSLARGQGLEVNFVVTDLKEELPVHYTGVVPDLFREGKGVIAEGSIDEHHTFVATQILAKHDENYMPKNVYKALRENAAQQETTP
jgi:cytochrome c-type biogenesis protein CcmE